MVLGFEAHGGRACPGGRPKAKALGYEPLVSRWPVMPGLKSGPISEAKATTERVYSAAGVVRSIRGQVGVTDGRPPAIRAYNSDKSNC